MNEVLARVHKRICSTVLCFCTVIPEIYAKANRKKSQLSTKRTGKGLHACKPTDRRKASPSVGRIAGHAARSSASKGRKQLASPAASLDLAGDPSSLFPLPRAAVPCRSVRSGGRFSRLGKIETEGKGKQVCRLSPGAIPGHRMSVSLKTEGRCDQESDGEVMNCKTPLN